MKKTFTKKDYVSGDGMLTAVWGPSLWHYLHTISFNYPNNPTSMQKKKYKEFIYNLQWTLPCKHCRVNLKKNLKVFPLKQCYLKNREQFSGFVYRLHERINKQLGKKSNLSYCQVRERYENFRARCTQKKIFKFTRKKHKGCTTPLYGKKARCLIHIVPQNNKSKSMKIDRRCIKKKLIS